MTPDSMQSSGDRLALLYHLAQSFNSSLDLDEVLNLVMDEVIKATRAERGFVMLRSAPESEGGFRPETGEKLLFKVARGLDQRIIQAPQFEISRGTVERVAREGRPILTSDAQADERFNLRQSVMILGLRSVLCVPIKIKERVLGVIYVDNRLQAGIFTQADLDLLSSIASSAAIAVENARLYQVAVEKGRMEREMQMARKVQASLLPRSIPELPGWQFAASWRPAHEVGGDYYDFIPCGELTESPAACGQLAMLIADVTDKGMPAALFMASIRSMVRASTYHSTTPHEVITRTNRLICEESEDVLFVTVFYAHLDIAQGQFKYVNAGHNPVLLLHQRTRQIELLKATGMPLGIEVDAAYEQKQLMLESGDLVLFYTDGITDAMNTQEEDFGLERLEAVLQANPNASAGELIAAVERAVARFSGTAAPFDDLTLAAIRRL